MPKRRRKTRTHVEQIEDDESKTKAPRTMVVKMGKVNQAASELVENFRKVLMPYTAQKLKTRKRNKVKDFADVAAPLGVTHVLIMRQAGETGNVNLRIGCCPRGPTLAFHIKQYSLMRHVAQIQKRPVTMVNLFTQPPLVVLNNFQDRGHHVKLAALTIQNMFPAINVQTVLLPNCQRVVLFHYEAAEEGGTAEAAEGASASASSSAPTPGSKQGTVHMRHYAITATPAGLSRRIKRLVRTSNPRIPDLSGCRDISEFLGAMAAGRDAAIDGAVESSGSEAEDDTNTVTLADRFKGKGNRRAWRSKIKLVEIGPRFSMQLTKVESGFCEGDVLYHAYFKKTHEEAAELARKARQKVALRAERRAAQEKNIEAKFAARDAERDAKQAAREERHQERLTAAAAEARAGGAATPTAADDEEEESSSDDDGEGADASGGDSEDSDE